MTPRLFPFVYRLTLEYDGAGFAGWQVQPGRRTVQGVLETALRRLFRTRVPTVGASRTDAGVHAEGQVASFRAPFRFRGDLAAALNRNLPDDVAVVGASEAADAFHARKDAVAKTYEYRIVNRPTRPVRDRARAAWVAAPLDLRRMRREAKRLLTRRDFREFGGRSSRDRSPLCRVTALDVRRTGDTIIITLTADRFLHNMARRLAGHLVNAGLGAAKNPPRTMPPQGLTLKRVDYQKALKRRFDSGTLKRSPLMRFDMTSGRN